MLPVFAPILNAINALSLCSSILSSQAPSDDSKFSGDLKRLDEIYARLDIIGGDGAEARASMILSGLQFSPKMQRGPTSALSGGEKAGARSEARSEAKCCGSFTIFVMRRLVRIRIRIIRCFILTRVTHLRSSAGWRMRVSLAAALFIEPDLLMLDEPTNHLDLEAVLWLEQYLIGYRHTLVVVSHDRGFLNEICSDIIEFKDYKLNYYKGDYDTYVKTAEDAVTNQKRVYAAYKDKRAHMQEFVDKFRFNAKRASLVQSRIKAIEKLDLEAPDNVEIEPVWRFSIENPEPLGIPIISVNDIDFDYDQEKPKEEYLLKKVNFGIDLQSKIGILGPNGAGKSTLLNLIMGKLSPLKGDCIRNGRLRIAYFTQVRHEEQMSTPIPSLHGSSLAALSNPILTLVAALGGQVRPAAIRDREHAGHVRASHGPGDEAVGGQVSDPRQRRHQAHDDALGRAKEPRGFRGPGVREASRYDIRRAHEPLGHGEYRRSHRGSSELQGRSRSRESRPVLHHQDMPGALGRRRG